MSNPNPPPPPKSGRFQKGRSGNPSGQSSERQKLRERYVADVHAEWLKRGRAALAELPAEKLVAAAADVAGKDGRVRVNQRETGTVEDPRPPKPSRRIAEALPERTERNSPTLPPP